MVLAPGFIDPHSHSDFSLLTDGNAESKIRQGVTTEVIGESGSVAPQKPTAERGWSDFAGYFSAIERGQDVGQPALLRRPRPGPRVRDGQRRARAEDGRSSSRCRGSSPTP